MNKTLETIRWYAVAIVVIPLMKMIIPLDDLNEWWFNRKQSKKGMK